ncbi:MAG: T9SS type A sorting domain-containing protein [Paludibacter sp.]
MKENNFYKFLILVFLVITTGVYSQSPDWGRVIQSNNFGIQRINAVSADNLYEYVVAGISGSVVFDSTKLTSVGYRDMLLVKLANGGKVVWKKQFNAQIKGTVYGYTIKSDNNGNVYVVGYLDGSLTIGNITISSISGDNGFIAKFDGNGNGIWATSFYSTGTGVNNKFVIDSQSNIYLISKSTKFIKFDANGLKLWEQTYADKTLQAIATNGSSLFIGGVILAGTTNFGTISLTSLGGTYNGVILKADFNGNFTNSFLVKGSTTSYGSSVSDIQIDNKGKLLIAGFYRKNLELGTMIITNTSTSYYTYLAKCNENFEFSWSKTSSMTNPTSFLVNDFLFSYKLYQDNLGNVYEYGSLKAPINYGTVSINPNEGQYIIKFDSVGIATSSYLLSYSDGSNTTITPTGKILIGETYNYEGSFSYGDFSVKQYSNNFIIDWKKSSSQSFSGNIEIRRTKHDSAGNTYIYGTTIGKTNFFGTTISNNTTTTFIAKFDINGQKVWSRFISEIAANNFGTVFTLDKDNNILLTGLFYSQLNIVDTQTLTTTNTGYEGYVAKFNSSGDLIWASKYNRGKDIYNSISIATDHSGNVLVSGVDSPANYIIKFDSQGAKLWEKSFDMASYYIALISTDGNDNIYLSSEVHLDNIPVTSVQIGGLTLSQTVTDGSTALIKFDPNGNALWVKTYGGVDNSQYTDGWPCQIKTDNSGNTYIWGWCPNNAKFGNNVLVNPFSVNQDYSYFLTKINTSGDVTWAKAVYESAYAFNYGDLLDYDANGNVYVGGQFKSTINIDNNNFTAQGTNDFFIAKFNSNGEYKWIKTVQGDSYISYGISVYNEDVLSFGGYAGTALAIGNSTINKLGGTNTFIATLGNLKTGLSDISKNQLEIYPNPTSDYIYISNFTGNSSIKITDITGKIIMKTQTDQRKLNVSGFPQGLYIITVKDANGERTVKFSKY